MAKIILCLFFTAALVAARPLLAQEDKWATNPFLLCNLIVVKTDEDTKSLRQKLQASFIRQGYRISSPDGKTITGKAQLNNTFEVTVTAAIAKGSISYAGSYTCKPVGASRAAGSTSLLSTQTFKGEIAFQGTKNSDKMAAFSKMNSLAKAYGGATYYFFQ